MSTREDILIQIRTWIKAYALPGTPLTDAQVIAANSDITLRPALPYITILQSSHGQVVAHDEVIHSIDGGGNPLIKMQGVRRGSAQIHVYGSVGEEWLENLTWSLKNPDMVRTTSAAGLTVEAPLGGIQDLTGMMGANRERHYVLEFPYSYRVESGTMSATPLENVVHDSTLYTTDPASGTLDTNTTTILT